MLKLIIAGVISVIISYLLGSCNSSIIVVRILKHEDIREHGSKNAGLTNTLRCYGKIPALLTLIGDLAKGIVAVLISILIFNLIVGADGFDRQTVGYISGIAAILGHIFPIYYGFKGGKGILVSSSILIVIDPLTFAIIIPFFAIVLLISKYVSVASISAAVFYPFLTFLLHYFVEKETLGLCLTHTGLVAVTSILLIYMHRANIERLKNGTENKFFKKKTEIKEANQMNRTIKSMEDKYLIPSLELIEKVFTEHESESEGKTVRRLAEEIRSKKYYLPELELIMTDENDDVIGYAMFSRFHIEGKYEDELLILTPVAVKTELQRQHISKELIEYGFEKAKKMGFKAVLVEGDPKNYNPRGFETSFDHGIVAGPNIHLPHVSCLMIKELERGALDNISGTVDYSFYDTLLAGGD